MTVTVATPYRIRLTDLISHVALMFRDEREGFQFFDTFRATALLSLQPFSFRGVLNFIQISSIRSMLEAQVYCCHASHRPYGFPSFFPISHPLRDQQRLFETCLRDLPQPTRVG
jgi:hypothetical protein